MRSFIFIAVVSLLAVACGGSPTAPTTGATLNVRITDEPLEDVMAILVTFNDVSVHLADGEGEGWMEVLGLAGITCDLRRLEGESDVMGFGILPAGCLGPAGAGFGAAAQYRLQHPARQLPDWPAAGG